MRIHLLTASILAAVLLSGLGAAAEEATPEAFYKPRAKDCKVSPIPEQSVAESQERVLVLEATPRPVLGHEDVTDPLEADSLPLEELPAGIPADAATVEEITVLEREYAACFNAGEFYRAAALVTGEARLVVVALAEFFETEFGDESPIPPVDYQIPAVSVRDVRVLPDGRVGAIVDWKEETLFHIYENVDGVWLASEEIRLY